MCVLCGEVVTHVHWTDRRRGESTARSTIPEQADHDRSRRRGHLDRVGLARSVLSAYGLGLSDWAGRRYLLTDRKGGSAIAADLGALWPAAERLAGCPLDPLDPRLLETLGRRARTP